MLIRYQDFNDADTVISDRYNAYWQEIAQVLSGLRLHLKASDQAGLQGTAIFDAVGTNSAIKQALVSYLWHPVPIPEEYRFLGTGIDFGKTGAILEVQFSHYAFILNNLLRGELFFKARTALLGQATDLVVIVTKAHMFPASQGTLYYEQAVSQLAALAKFSVFTVPLRVVGLYEPEAGIVPVIWTDYHAKRQSRTVVTQQDRRCEIRRGTSPRSRCVLHLSADRA